MRENCKDLEKAARPLEILEEEAVPVKVVFRNLINDHLKRIFKVRSFSFVYV